MKNKISIILSISFIVLTIIIGLILGLVIESGGLFWKVFAISVGCGFLCFVLPIFLYRYVKSYIEFVKRKKNSVSSVVVKSSETKKRSVLFVVWNSISIAILTAGLVASAVMQNLVVLLTLGVFCVFGIVCCVYNIIKGER